MLEAPLRAKRGVASVSEQSFRAGEEVTVTKNIYILFLTSKSVCIIKRGLKWTKKGSLL